MDRGQTETEFIPPSRFVGEYWDTGMLKCWVLENVTMDIVKAPLDKQVKK